MATYYVYSGAAGAANGTSWANAYTTMTAAFSGKAAGDVFYVAHDHAESTAGAVTLTSPGTVANPCKIICVNRSGSVPPVSADLRTTGQITGTGNNQMTFNGSAHWVGLIIDNGSGGTSRSIFLCNSATSSMRFDNCSIRISSTSGGTIYAGTFSGQTGVYVEFNNTTVRFSGTGSVLEVAGRFAWRNTPSAIETAGSIPTNFFALHIGVPQLECIGVDFSALGSGKTLVNASSLTGSTARFIDCKLDANVTKVGASTYHGATDVDFIRCGSSGVNYNVSRIRYTGTLTEETTIVRTGGASDGTTPIAWNIITTASCSYSMPFDCPPIAIWNDTTGSAKTATVEGIWGGGAVPNDDDIWLDLEYLGDASSPQGSFVNDGKADLLATAALQATSSATWTVSTIKTILNSLDKEGHITLSGGNLTATGTAGWTGFVRAVDRQTTGKFYFEMTFNAVANNSGVGVSISSISVSSAAGFATVTAGMCGIMRSGVIYVDGAATFTLGGVPGSTINFGTISSGTVICVAIDTTAKLIWFRLGASGNWNNNASYNPATGVGGASIPNVTAAYPTISFGGADTIIANFGSTAFAGAVPSGFISGWPANYPAFNLSVPFTAQQKGWIYARVKCAKASSTFYIDPLVTLT